MKLNQVIAIEKGVKSRVYSEISETHKLCQKPDLFSGFSRTYRKLNDQSEDLPAEQKRVQYKVADILKGTRRSLSEYFDITAAKDWANMGAVADVVVGTEKLLEKTPVTYLLFLEKQLTDIKTFVEKLPELDEMNDWTREPESAIYKTPITSTHRSKKIPRPIVKYDATKEHPAQTELIADDVLVGYWDTVHHSGGIAKTEKAAILERVEMLIKAVKFAREEANGVDAERKDLGEKIFTYLGF